MLHSDDMDEDSKQGLGNYTNVDNIQLLQNQNNLTGVHQPLLTGDGDSLLPS